ncbi:PilZ domain-containing protein [Qipengyuania sp. NPDC077563]|uniref:PilZ domain-containing protein n=1 Tax=Qipengyuania sp. NPDC077563 TaxID=3364497 RepID=UPI00384E16D0
MKARTNVRRGTDIVLHCRIPVDRAQAILCDISDTGCRIQLFDGYVNKGTTIFFELDEQTDLAGQIVWVQGGEAGVRCMHKLSPAARKVLEI